jgi:hypothetical protein
VAEEDGGLYDQKDAAGFIKLQALRLRTLTAAQPGLVGSAGGGGAGTVGGDVGAYAGATSAADPIEELCAEDPAADECRVYED